VRLVLIALLGASFWFPVPGNGEIVIVEGTWANLEYSGVFVLEGDNGNPTPACTSYLRRFRCVVTAGALTQVTVSYTPHQPARCSAAPRLDVTIDGAPALTLLGGPPPPHCLYLPL
jgi:hypothetical protein